jgi:hypothetical protein
MHPLHEAVGDILRSVEIERPELRMLLDNACGGKGQQIRLFGDEPVGNSSCLAWVDAAIVFNDEIKVVIEIEETNVRPLYLCGKVFATALCNYSSRNGTRTPLAASMLFIQVIKEPERKVGAKPRAKVLQCEYLQKTINEIFRKLENRIHLYSFHHGLAESFAPDAEGATELRDEIVDFIDRPAPKTIT